MLILCVYVCVFSPQAVLDHQLTAFWPYQQLTGLYCGQCLTAKFRGQASLLVLYGPAFHPILRGDKGQESEREGANGFGLPDKRCRPWPPPSPLDRRPLQGLAGHKFSGH